MKIRSDNLTVATARKADIPELDELYSEACGYFGFNKPYPLRSPLDSMTGADLPDGGHPENYELLTLRVSETLIGYAAIYRDFPAKTAVHIRLMFIGDKARCYGFGTDAVKQLCRYFYEAGYGCMTAEVSLRNWGALRFWQRLGFDRAVALDAPGDESDGSFGSVTLEKTLVRGK